jgi:hypothetical protein
MEIATMSFPIRRLSCLLIQLPPGFFQALLRIAYVWPRPRRNTIEPEIRIGSLGADEIAGRVAFTFVCAVGTVFETACTAPENTG